MRTLLCLCLLLCVAMPAPANGAVLPAITAEAAVVMDLDTGQVLYGKGEHERRPPASLTKVMTGYLAGKQFQAQQWITVSETAASTGESSLLSLIHI